LNPAPIKYRYVYLSFFIFWLISVFWISSPHPVAIVGLVALAGFLSLYWLLFFVSARSAIHLLHLPAVIAVPICWIGCEFLRNNLLGGFSFCSIEHLLFAIPILIQIADIGGEYLVGGMIMSVGTGIGTILFTGVLNCSRFNFRFEPSADSLSKNRLLRSCSAAFFMTELISKFCPKNIFTNSLAGSNNVTKNISDNISDNTGQNVTDKFISVQKKRNQIFVTIIITLFVFGSTIAYGYLTMSYKRNLFDNNSLGSNSNSNSDSNSDLTLTIASLQGNSPVSINMTNQQLSDCLKQYIELTRAAVQTNNGKLDLIIWPETVCPVPYIIFQNGATYENLGLNPQALEFNHEMLLKYSVETMTPILYGISTWVVDNNRNKKSANQPLRLNSALLVVPNPPEFKARYDKIQLVMFGEYVPFADYLPENFPLRSICQEAGRGKLPVAIPIKDNVFASVNICFESTVPHHVRRQILSLRRAGCEPVLLINISNSGWFGFKNQIEQHLATHIFRAVENRRPYIAAANGGFSAAINCFGQITKIGKRKAVEPVIDQIKIQHWTPIYHYLGDLPAIICTIIMSFCTLYAYKKNYKNKKMCNILITL
jgi:apolipoprotein N-acyltransferase